MKDMDNGHDAMVFVFGNVSMVDEIANVLSSEVHTDCDARVRVVWISIPIRCLDRIKVLALEGRVRLAAVNLEIVL